MPQKYDFFGWGLKGAIFFERQAHHFDSRARSSCLEVSAKKVAGIVIHDGINPYNISSLLVIP
jgi:hypothetical protein